MGKRESGVDLVRCIGLLLVVGFHFFLYNGFYAEPMEGGAMLAATGFRWLTVACNGLFMTLTGYLKSTQPLSPRYYRSLAPVLLGYALASALSIPVRHFFLGEALSLAEWVGRFFGFGGCYYGWYVEMYVGLILLSPVVNLALERLTGARGPLWLAGTMLLVTALPSATDLALPPDYWVACYPLTYYVLGAVIRRLRLRLRPGVGLPLSLAAAMGLGWVTWHSTGGAIDSAYTQSFGGFWITVIVVLLFLSLHQLRPGPRLARVLAWAAGGCFEGYLLSHLLDAWVYRAVPAWHTPGRYALAFCLLTVPIWLLSILAGRLLHGMVKKILQKKEEIVYMFRNWFHTIHIPFSGRS